MPDPSTDVARKKGRALVIRISLSTVLAVVAVVAVLWNIGHVANQQWNPTKEASVQRIPKPDGSGDYSICVVELDDQGVMWDPAQLDWTLEHLGETIRDSAHGTIVLVFVHGWKQDASRHDDPKSRLALFHRDVERIAWRVEEDPGPDPALVGVYFGWRGRSFTIPMLENLTFWNRRVAAARAASVGLLECLLEIGTLVGQDRMSKTVVMGHSLGGAIVERVLAPTLVSSAVKAAGTSRPAPVLFDLVVLANPASSALDAERLIGFFDRKQVRLVTIDPDGALNLASGPLIASINAEDDLVNRISYPIGMWFNSLVLRYRKGHAPGEPSQRRLAIRAAGHERSLISHEARVAADGTIELAPRGRATPGAPYWIIRVPDSISAGHSDLTGEHLGTLIGDLMERNRVFDPEIDLALAAMSESP